MHILTANSCSDFSTTLVLLIWPLTALNGELIHRFLKSYILNHDGLTMYICMI